MPKSPLLVSRQPWKLGVGFGLLAVSGIFTWFDSGVSRLLGFQRYIPTLIGTFIGLSALAFLALALRCPGCGLRLFWHAISKKPINAWGNWLFETDTCPKCGYQAKE